MIIKIKFEQRYLDDALKAHVKELLEKLVNVASDDEDGDKENLNENDDDAYETDEDEQVEDEMKSDENLIENSVKNKKDQNNNVEESMEVA